VALADDAFFHERSGERTTQLPIRSAMSAIAFCSAASFDRSSIGLTSAGTTGDCA
jgi:hypothetical protein